MGNKDARRDPLACPSCGYSVAIQIVDHLVDGDGLVCGNCREPFELPDLDDEARARLLDQSKEDATGGCLGLVGVLALPQLLALLFWYLGEVRFIWALCVGCIGQVVLGYVIWMWRVGALDRSDIDAPLERVQGLARGRRKDSEKGGG